MRLENTPGGRVVSWLLLRERTNGDGNEGGREKWNEREARLSRPSNTPGGREERLLEEKEKESDVKVCVDGMKKK